MNINKKIKIIFDNGLNVVNIMKNFKNKTLVRIAISVLLSISIVSACSSGNPTTPNQQTLTNLAKQPSATTETSVKDISLSGRVIDSITRKPIEKATVLVYVISNDNILKAVKAGVKNIEVSKYPLILL